MRPSFAALVPSAVSSGTLIRLTGVPRDQVLETPGQVGHIDPKHGRAHADHGREEVDAFVGILLCQSIDQVKLGADPPGRARRVLRAIVLMMNSVEPTRSAASTTCIMHSG